MHPQHRILLANLKANAAKNASKHADAYTGSGRPHLGVTVPLRRKIARAWLKENKPAPPPDALALLDSLFAGASHEEKTLAAILLADMPEARAAASMKKIENWLDQLHGWAEIDSLCQNVFTAEIAANWGAWKSFLTKLAKDENIYKRRAALVFLVGPVHYFDDPRFSGHAFTIISKLKAERNIVITKAVSWLLRSMTTRHKSDVAAYLAANEETLPKIALRETRTKLHTGTKSGRAKANA
ncbi:MAG: DNA alkylation repair protein [Caulobacterales bacterium]